MPDPETPPASDAATPEPSPNEGTRRDAPAASGSAGPALVGGARRRWFLPRRGRRRVVLFAVGGAALAAGAVGLVAAGRSPTAPPVYAATLAGSLSGAPVFDRDAATTDDDAGAAPDAAPQHEAAWRVAQLGPDAGVSLLRGSIERRPLLVALGAAGLSRGEAARVARSLAEVRQVDHFGSKDAFTVARDKATGRVVAYEVTDSPTDVWQAREESKADGARALVARKLDLAEESVRVHKAVLVGADLRASLTEAGLTPVDDVLTMIDDALEGHAELADIRPGARLRLVGSQEFVEGAFARWLSLDAVEYFPATEHAPPVRVYQFVDEDSSKRHRGWYDAHGRQPVHGGWRMPVPLARIASRFNPHRMHPILHVIMPHNGVDLAAPAGAPVYATAAGVVSGVGFAGPCGNRVEIDHPRGMTSIYCHLSRYAAGLHVGEHVEQRQLIAYVGQTGRVTGPHLHFAIRRGGTYIDPLSLRLDGVRVVARAQRDDFDQLRARLDAELDSIPLPVPPAAPAAAPAADTEPETFYEEPP